MKRSGFHSLSAVSMKLFNKSLPLVIVILLSISSVIAQPVSDLKKEKEKLEKEISFTKNKIAEIKSKQHLSLAELVTLRKQIDVRTQLVTNISSQIKTISSEINENKSIIHSLEKDIAQLREEYAKQIYNTYINRNEYDDLLFVFSANGFNDAFKRIQYLKEYTSYRKMQAEMINKTQRSLKVKIDELEQKKKEKEALLKAETDQTNILNREKTQINTRLNDFKNQESHYAKLVRSKEKEAAKLNKQIERMIAEAAKAKSSGSSGSGGIPALTPEAKKLSADFISNKGKLPWPVERGTIIRGFGKKKHAVLKDVYTNNNGIDISTTKQAGVRAVFNGEVMNTFYHPVFHRGIIISHGEYFSVYLNLQDLHVSEGDKVTTKQIIGTAFTSEENSTSEVHLEIWQGTTILNPSLWLSN